MRGDLAYPCRMRRTPTAVCLIACVLALSGCAGSAQEAVSSPAPAQSASTSAMEPADASPSMPTTSSSPAATATGFADVVDAALSPYAALIGAEAGGAGLTTALPLFDGDVPLPDGTVVGAGRLVERWGDALESTQVIGLGAAPSKADLEAYGAAAPAGWTYNSISTTDSSSTLVMTREADGLRIAYKSSTDPRPGEPPAEFALEANAAEIPQPAWLGSLPIPSGGELTAVGEGIGDVELNYLPASSGFVTATWRFPADQLMSLQEFYASDALAAAGFSLADPDSIQFGASYFDITSGDWSGQVIVGELLEGEDSYASVQWLLTRQ